MTVVCTPVWPLTPLDGTQLTSLWWSKVGHPCAAIVWKGSSFVFFCLDAP